MGAIHGSKNGLYMRAIMGYIWEPYIGVIYGSKNGLYMRVRIGYTWKQEWAIYRSRI